MSNYKKGDIIVILNQTGHFFATGSLCKVFDCDGMFIIASGKSRTSGSTICQSLSLDQIALYNPPNKGGKPSSLLYKE